MNQGEAEKRIAALRNLIRKHDHLYYVQGAAEEPVLLSEPAGST